MGRVRRRIGDKRVLEWVKAFLRAWILTEDGLNRDTITGTPQGGILSPLLANIALSVLDEHFAAKWEVLGPEWKRVKYRRVGGPVMKLIRYADDFVVMLHGTLDDAETLWGEVSSSADSQPSSTARATPLRRPLWPWAVVAEATERLVHVHADPLRPQHLGLLDHRSRIERVWSCSVSTWASRIERS